uniref:LIM domain only 4 n=1 Tax=Naja naja TaxID=35670 RepID=A0A8C6VDV0_NAJNA
ALGAAPFKGKPRRSKEEKRREGGRAEAKPFPGHLPPLFPPPTHPPTLSLLLLLLSRGAGDSPGLENLAQHKLSGVAFPKKRRQIPPPSSGEKAFPTPERSPDASATLSTASCTIEGKQTMVNPGSSSQPPPVTSGSLSWKRCAGCGGKIADRFLLYAMDSYWHSRCLKCSCCQAQLGEIGTSCYTKSGMILCRNDYISALPVQPAETAWSLETGFTTSMAVYSVNMIDPQLSSMAI